MGPAMCFMSEYDGFFVVVAVTLAFDIKIKGKKETGNLEEIYDKEKLRVVIERTANEIRLV